MFQDFSTQNKKELVALLYKNEWTFHFKHHRKIRPIFSADKIVRFDKKISINTGSTITDKGYKKSWKVYLPILQWALVRPKNDFEHLYLHKFA